MPSAPVEAAFRTRLTSLWDGTVPPDGATSPPEGAAKYAVIQYPVSQGERPVLGRRFTEEGVARVVLTMPVETTLASGLAEADAIAAMFRALPLGVLGAGIETFTVSPPVISDSNAEGNWLELAVLVPYRYQFDG